MNRFLRTTFICVAALSGVGVVLFVCDLQAAGLPVMRAKTLWALLIGTAFFFVGAWRFSMRTKFKIFCLLFSFLFVEAILQALSWLGVLPAVNTKERLPWGRVYWTAEGLGNSIRNRYGWYFPEFDLERANRAAIIGDSIVEAVEVHRTRNIGALLRNKVRAASSQLTVMGFGNHGVGPAHYLEILKYAHRHFGSKEAIIVIYLGNDVTDCSPRLQFHDPEQYLYYTLAPHGVAVLDARGERVRAAYVRELEALHGSPWVFLPRIVASHCMLLQLPLSVQRTIALRKRIEQDRAHNIAMETPLAQLGLKSAPFALSPSPETREAMMIMKSLLDQATDFAHANNIKLRIMTVPFFPPDFYAQSGPEWTAQLGDFDFLAPDRELKAWAAERNIPFLSLAEHMRLQQLNPEGIRALYLTNGSGHFSEAGHRFAAEALQSAFFSSAREAQ